MGKDRVWKRPYPSFHNSSPLHQAHATLERAPAGGQVHSTGPGVREDAESGRVLRRSLPPTPRLVLTTITALGVGPLISRCTIPNRWLYIFECPQSGGGICRGSLTVVT